MASAAPALPEIGIAELLAELGAGGRRLATDGTIETTFRCNLACAHCYVNQPAQSREEKARELPTARLLALIDEIAAAGCFNLLLTGGEVFCREDFPAVYLHAIGRGLRVQVFTNGTLVTDRIADLLADHPPVVVEVTIYGATRETYERVTGVPGSYGRCMAGIERLRIRGVPLALKTMLLTWNEHERDAMAALAAEHGLRFREDGMLNARVDCGANRNPELQIPAARLLALELRDDKRRRELERSAQELRERIAQPVRAERVYSCGAGEKTFNVDPYGSLQMCQLTRGSGFDLRTGAFADGWERHFPKLRERQWQANDRCGSCVLLASCANCPGTGENEHGNPEAVVAHFCELTHRRAFAMLSDVPGHREDGRCCFGRPDGGEAQAGCGGGCAAAPRPPAAPLLQLQVRRPRATPA